MDYAFDHAWLADEAATVARLAEGARTAATVTPAIRRTAVELVNRVRADRADVGGLRAFLQHYDLSTEEGVVLMCLAEALLRIPDSDTVDALIADKLEDADWARHLGRTESTFVNVSTWGLMLSGRILELEHSPLRDPVSLLGRLAARLEEPILRAALKAGMRIMAGEFVMGRNIEQALDRARSAPFKPYRFSFDMLGEAALCEADAERYLDAYRDAIAAIGADAAAEPVPARAGISVKLSALYPRFEPFQADAARAALTPRLLSLAVAAADVGIPLTVDAEEADRLALTVEVFGRVRRALELAHWSGLGLAVQAYQKRALPVLATLQRLAEETGTAIPLRLVKGAYWDTEVKRAQEQALADYPVFTRKANTDVSFLACARFLLDDCPQLYPQFATHNAHTVSYVCHHAGDRAFEFQRLHGMGEALYTALPEVIGRTLPCRVYAPVGAHADLLPYLVRRLLENGANSSFVNQLVHDGTTVDDLVADPLAAVERNPSRHSQLPLPRALHAPERMTAAGVNFADSAALAPLLAAVSEARDPDWVAAPVLAGRRLDGTARAVFDPADREHRIGRVDDADEAAARQAVDVAAAAFPEWNATPATVRADLLAAAADRLEAALPELTARCVREAGKTVRDGHDDVREAIDFLRYYAARAREQFGAEVHLPGPAGEANRLRLGGRGVFVCISPWNFPAAIFTGQLAAALAAGNSVVVKPAEQTSLVAARITELLHAAGIPPAALNFLPGDGATLGAALLDDPRVAGVAFTGSTATAQWINRRLAAREGPLATLIAETGGINAMIVDSSALPEQVVHDVVHSAFNSAGQRCSALRVLCLQDEIAPRVMELLQGYLALWRTGDPAQLESDMGPVIDAAARADIENYLSACAARRPLVYRGPAAASSGLFVPPAIVAIDSLEEVTREVFGPVLHVLRFHGDALDATVEAVNGLGYGLTCGIHSRIESRARSIAARVRCGNVYINRNMVGAVVGTQPFGGRGLSGTGPKAGGPNYLLRFATEQTVTENVAAIGGNAALFADDS